MRATHSDPPRRSTGTRAYAHAHADTPDMRFTRRLLAVLQDRQRYPDSATVLAECHLALGRLPARAGTAALRAGVWAVVWEVDRLLFGGCLARALPWHSSWDVVDGPRGDCGTRTCHSAETLAHTTFGCTERVVTMHFPPGDSAALAPGTDRGLFTRVVLHELVHVCEFLARCTLGTLDGYHEDDAENVVLGTWETLLFGHLFDSL